MIFPFELLGAGEYDEARVYVRISKEGQYEIIHQNCFGRGGYCTFLHLYSFQIFGKIGMELLGGSMNEK